MKVFDEKNKQLTWLTRNYFYLATLTFVFINFMFFTCSPSLQNSIVPTYQTLNGLLLGIVNSFTHYGWQHLLLNMLCFTVISLYLERKFGSIKYFVLVLFNIIFSSVFFSTVGDSNNWGGFSVTIYSLYGVLIVTYIYTVIKNRKDKTNNIWGGITVALIILAMCFNEEGGFPFKPYPVDLITNAGHYSGIIVGLLVSCILLFIKFIINHDYVKKEDAEYIEIFPKWQKITALSLVGVFSVLIILFATLSATNTTCKVNLVSNIKEFNITTSYKASEISPVITPQMIIEDIKTQKDLSTLNGYAFNVSLSKNSDYYNSSSKTDSCIYYKNIYEVMPLAPLTVNIVAEKQYSIKIEKSDVFSSAMLPVQYFYNYENLKKGLQDKRYYIFDDKVYDSYSLADMFWISPKEDHLSLSINTSLIKSTVNTSKLVIKVNGEIVTPKYNRIDFGTLTQNVVISISEQA